MPNSISNVKFTSDEFVKVIFMEYIKIPIIDELKIILVSELRDKDHLRYFFDKIHMRINSVKYDRKVLIAAPKNPYLGIKTKFVIILTIPANKTALAMICVLLCSNKPIWAHH